MPASSETGLETLRLRLLGFEAQVETDVPEVAAYGRDLFRRFLADSVRPDYTLAIRTAPGGFRVRDGLLDAVVVDRAWLPGILAARLLEQTGNQAMGYDVFHGAALARNGHGLIVCGESGHGKSTLTLALLRDGWGFLSDECAAVERDDARLVAFPKALEVRPGSPALAGLPDAGPARRGVKRLVDPEHWFPGCLIRDAPLHTAGFLHGGAAKQPAPDELSIEVHERSAALPARLRALDGVEAATWADAAGTTILLRCDRARLPPAAIEEAAAALGLLILGSSADVAPPTDFNRPPRLEALPLTAGVQALLAQFRGRRAFSARIAEHGGYAGLFLAMVERLADVRFFRLHVGHLDESVQLLHRQVG